MLVQGVENISEIREEFKAKVTHLQSYRTCGRNLDLKETIVEISCVSVHCTIHPLNFRLC